MSHAADTRITATPPSAVQTSGLFRWVCTNNPFYVLSAGLFLVGLRISFGAQAEAIHTWALMSGLVSYTILLAVTGWLLVRFTNVWDDVRTVLLLVVLMFLATSVTFDEVLVMHPIRGYICCLAGLLFAVAVSEGLLRGTGLRLPVLFRVPYYLILALFFLYPLALSTLVNQPHSEALMWGLFGFSPLAGLISLTLLPAIRRGEEYVRDNGSPWRWPMYPWVLFGLLAFAVLARSVLLCYSMHLLIGPHLDSLVFGLYFLVPFGLCLCILILEIGIVSQRRGAIWTALVGPVWLIGLALIHRADPIYEEFLAIFSSRLGGDPLYLTMLASVVFYIYATLRRVHAATEMLTAALVALAFVGPDTLNQGRLVAPQALPILLAALLQLVLALWRRSSLHCLVCGIAVAIACTLALPGEAGRSPWRGMIGYHLALIAVLTVAALFDDPFALLLRIIGAGMMLLACIAALFGAFEVRGSVVADVLAAYPLVMGLALAGYGWWLRDQPLRAAAAVILVCWVFVWGAKGYMTLRQLITGLDHIVISLVLFAVAILISLGKSGQLSRWMGHGGGNGDSPGELEPPRARGPDPEQMVQVPVWSFQKEARGEK